MGRALGELTWGSVPEQATVLVPLGSCEQHGPHLPIDTDTLIAGTVAAAAAARLRDAIVAPALAITASGEHAGFAGTLSIGTAAMTSVLVELVRSAGWAARVVLVNGHGGNAPAVQQALAVLAHEPRPVTAWWPDLRGLAQPGDLHAGYVETSIMLAVRPDLVRLDEAVAGPTPALDDLVREGVRALSPSGVLGDPAGASAEAGHALLAALVDQLVAVLAP